MCCLIYVFVFLFRFHWGFFLFFFWMVGLHLEFFRSVMVALWFVFCFFVFFFSASVRGVRRREVGGGRCMVSRTGALFVLFFHFPILTTLVLQLLRLLRISLLHYTVSHFNCFSFCYTACKANGDCRRLSCYYGWGLFFYFVWLGL